MEAATYILLVYSLAVVVSLVITAIRRPVRGTGGPHARHN
jgi:hypothetical protein